MVARAFVGFDLYVFFLGAFYHRDRRGIEMLYTVFYEEHTRSFYTLEGGIQFHSLSGRSYTRSLGRINQFEYWSHYEFLHSNLLIDKNLDNTKGYRLF